jgi:acid phosphatase type 7
VSTRRAALVVVVGGLVALLARDARAASYTYVAEGTPLVYLKGTAAPPADWRARTAAETGWTAAAPGFGIGYGDGDDRTVLADMQNSYLTVYVRAHFTVGAERASLQQVSLRARFDDGFVAYLNGTEIGRASVPAGALLPTTAAINHEVTDGEVSFALDPALLVAGDNVLAVEVHNASLGSSDLSFIPLLTAVDAAGPSALLTLGPYVQDVRRREVTLCWETDVPSPARVAYGLTPALGLVAEEPTLAIRHELRLTDLRPGTDYYYRVESAAGVGSTATTRTEGDRTSPLRVAAFGDTRSNAADHARVVAGVVAQAPHLALHTGDLVESSTVANWATFFSLEAPLVARTLLLPAIGNHEGDAVLYREKLVLPPDSPGGERYYARRFAQVAVVTLDEYGSGYAAGSVQAQWLQQTLAELATDPGIRFVFVELHHGPYSSGSHGSNPTVRTDLAPLFEQSGVAIVFSGHDHDYERSTTNGVKYVVTGGGGAPLYTVPGASFTEAKCSCLHYCLMEIEGATLHFRALSADGATLIDEFWLGQNRSECTAPADCESRPAGPCTAPDTGAWACVQHACLWSCTAPVPPSDGGTPADGPVAGDGAVAGDGPAPDRPGAHSGGRGCGCEAPGGAALAGTAAGLLLLLGLRLGASRPRRRPR